MKKISKKKWLTLASSTLILVGLFGPTLISVHTVSAAAKDDVCEGIQLTGGSCDAPAAGEPTVNSTIQTVINILSIIVGVAAVIMIIVGGLQYVLSAGDSAKTSTAKNTILYAVIGLAIVALAQVIVNFTLNRVGPPAP